MKTTIIAVIALIVGFAIGTFYGWRTGVVDGQILTSITPMLIIQKYGQHRTDSDIQSRDKIIDILYMGIGANLAVNNGLSPVAIFIQPKADAALLDLLASWNLDHLGNPAPLFPPGSPSDLRLQEVKGEMGDYYDRSLKQQTEKRAQTNLRKP
jgi:hypothetical protein